MRRPVQLENIERLRFEEGIEDVKLREEIRDLQAGDFVKLTFLNEMKAPAAETLLVRITSIRGTAFRGKLADGPATAALASLHLGSPVDFLTDHIHSIPKRQPIHGP